MKTPPPPAAGFSLIEVLVALALCALLAATTAAAVSFSSRAEALADQYAAATLLLPSLYAAQRLDPAAVPTEPAASTDWRLQHTTQIQAYPDRQFREWNRLHLSQTRGTVPPIQLSILNELP